MRPAIAALLALSLLGAFAVPARAQFYSLEGRFHCLDDQAATCVDSASSWPAPRPDGRIESKPAPVAGPAPPTQPAKTNPARVLSQSTAIDPVGEISLRLEAGKPAPDDVSTLRRAARQGDRGALELLAWCNLKGLGTRRDPIEAYLLYGAAASVGISNAQQNQATVYQNELTPDQRHQALMIEDSVVLPRPQ